MKSFHFQLSFLVFNGYIHYMYKLQIFNLIIIDIMLSCSGNMDFTSEIHIYIIKKDDDDYILYHHIFYILLLL